MKDVLRTIWSGITADKRRSALIGLRLLVAFMIISLMLLQFMGTLLFANTRTWLNVLLTVVLVVTLPFELWISVLIALWRRSTPRTLWREFQLQMSEHLETKLLVSHVLVVTLSLFVFSGLGFILFCIMLWSAAEGVSFREELNAIFSMTVFVLFIILVITILSIIVALIASRYMATRLSRQIVELTRATDEMQAGHLDARVTVLSDDEIGKLASRFNVFAERLETLDTQRRQFVANISHDLRTPIAIVRGHVDQQRREPDDETPSTSEAFASIDHEIQTLAKLVDDLFTLSRLEEAALAIEMRPVDVGKLIHDAVAGTRAYALRNSRVSVNAVVPEELPHAMGDATRITQILNNLIHNAIRHTPEGGLVIVTAEDGSAEGVVRFSVRDTGVGISEESLRKIFERFYQGDSRREGGAGLGLSIVKQLVDAQHGQVDVSSEIGVGTVFTITLPMAPRQS